MSDMEHEHLAIAKRHVAEGEQRVAQQTALLADLAKGGNDTIDAEALLQVMKETLALMYTHLDMILSEISQAGSDSESL